MIRLFASDLDGTLLNEKHQFDDVIVEGIQNRKFWPCFLDRDWAREKPVLRSSNRFACV